MVVLGRNSKIINNRGSHLNRAKNYFEKKIQEIWNRRFLKTCSVQGCVKYITYLVFNDMFNIETDTQMSTII